MHESEQINLRETTEGLVKLFAAFFGAAYVCGYLIASSHLEELGIRSGSVNMIRAKYIWLGFLYLLPLFVVAVATSLFRLNPTNFMKSLSSRFHRRKKRTTSYANRYSTIVLFTVVMICWRMMFFDAQLREETAWLICVVIIAFLLYQLVHRMEVFQADSLDQLTRSEFVFGRTTLADVRKKERDITHIRLCIDRSHDFKDAFWLISLLSLLWSAYYILARVLFPWLPYPKAELLVQYSDVFTFVSYACTLACLQIQLSTAFHRDTLRDSAASLLGPADRSIYSGIRDPAPGPELQSRKRARWVARTIVLLVLFLASIHGFTHVVYPLIPPQRGGGDYLQGAVADVCMRSPEILTGGPVPAGVQTVRAETFCPSGILVQDVIILEEDADAVYVASVYDYGVKSSEAQIGAAPSCGLQEWHVGTNGPRVVSLREPSIIGIRDKDTVEHFCNAIGKHGKSTH
jgi:hypothetical protein